MGTCMCGRCSNAAGTHRAPVLCGSPAAVPYFLSFYILGSFIFLNLIVAVVLDNFGRLHNVNPKLASATDLELFADAWAVHDPDATGFITFDKLPEVLLLVPEPLGLKHAPKKPFGRKGETLKLAQRLCMQVHAHAAMHACTCALHAHTRLETPSAPH